MIIAPNTEVTLHFSLALEDGNIVDSTFDRKPGTFNIGDETLPQGFEKLLMGLRAGDRRSFLVPFAQGFGAWRKENLHRFTLKELEHKTENTMSLGMSIVFQDASGQHITGIVKSIDQELADIDFNHPLAGKDLHFSVEILSVKAKAEAVNLIS